MIRVYKSPNAPLSLSTTARYDNEDVVRQLQSDHLKKCYLCERRLVADFQIEHHRSEKHYPLLRQHWDNLYWVCNYCNGKKLHHNDNLLHPTSVNIEEEIEHIVDFVNKRFLFKTIIASDSHIQTIDFLSKVHNGAGKIRKLREEEFCEKILEITNEFYRLVSRYLSDPSITNEELVRESLQIDKECLGFKYWIIKKHPQLSITFAKDIVWNKQ